MVAIRVIYLFSQYPAETFAVAEVKAVGATGIEVIPVALRGDPRRLHHRLEAWGLSGQPAELLSFRQRRVWSSLARFVAHHPVVFASETIKLLLDNAFTPIHLVKSAFVLLKAPAVMELARQRGADVVHVFWGHYPSFIGPVLKAGAPHCGLSVFLGAYTARHEMPSQRRLLEHADCLVTHYEGHMDDIRRLRLRGVKPVAMIRRGVDLQQTSKIRAGRSGPAARLVERVGIVCTLAPYKSVDHALRAFELVSRRRPLLELHVIGDGPERRALEACALALGIADRTRFLGRLGHADTLEAVAGFRLLMLTSLSEFYPNTIKEGMALGIPCVAYAVPGIVEMAQGGTSIRLARPGRIEEIAQRMAELLDDVELAERTIATADRRVRDFDIRESAARLAAVFRSLARRQPLPHELATTS